MESAPTKPTGLQFGLGVFFVLISIAASLTLVLEHFGSVVAPGCGVGGACEKAAASFWGSIRVGGFQWPTSFVGLAYFIAAAIGWTLSRGGASWLFRAIVRLGALASIGFLVVIIVGKHFCPYCVAAHVGNLLFWLMVETAGSAAVAMRRSSAAVAAAAVFVLASATLAGFEVPRVRAIAKQDQDQREAFARAQEAKSRAATATAPAATATAPATTVAASAPTPPPVQQLPFTGRYRIGAEDAPIRLVIFSDFQCADCQQVEAQVRAVLAGRDDISFSHKQMPMCEQCNRFMNGQRMHDNACWAARASEAAGILGGNDGFWRMHKWLFDHKGSFVDQEIYDALPGLGFEPQQFLAIMQSPTTEALVKADIEEGHALGLMFTPMIFINGIEVRGFIRQPDAIKKAVDAVAATNPPRATAASDHPIGANQKCVDDWKAQYLRNMPKSNHTWSLGPADAKIAVDVWTDLAFPLTTELDGIIRAQMKAGRSIRYTIREYPANTDCNPMLKTKTGSPRGCWAAAAAEAAGKLGGSEGFWRMLDWIGANRANLTDEALIKAAPSLGFEAPALLAMMASPEIRAAIIEDVGPGESYIMQGLPTVYVNGRWVPRWKLESVQILPMIFDEIDRGAAP